MRIALGVEYDGTAFCGWQRQPGKASVQEALETAVSAIAMENVNVVCAGRTDSGVHASAQVVHFDAPIERPLTAWVRGVNGLLPTTVAVLWAHPVPNEFHARFEAHNRSYLYRLLNHSVRPALMAGKLGWYHHPLDLGLMREGAQYLLGRHDFSAFRSSECQAKTPVKTLHVAAVSQRGALFAFSFTADAFLQHMVRNMVGALLAVGAGREKPQWIEEVLTSRNRRLNAATFSPDGLILTGVGYDPKWQLPAFQDRWIDSPLTLDDAPHGHTH